LGERIVDMVEKKKPFFLMLLKPFDRTVIVKMIE
jgi:hypothetical protein